MKMKSLIGSTLLALTLCATLVWACDEHAKKGVKKEGSADVQQVSDGRSETATAGDGTCSGHAAVVKDAGTTAGTPCSKKCSEECPHAKAMMAKSQSQPAGSSSCSGHAPAPAQTVALPETEMKVHAVLASLPTMKYRVGEETTGCSRQAAALAAKNGGKINYVVGDATLTDEGEAYAKLASLIDEESKSLQTVQYTVAGESMYCPQSAKKMAAEKQTTVAYRVAGFDFADQTRAEKAVEKAKEAVVNVKLAYKVGDQSFCCEKMAGAKAKETGKPIAYVVGTEEVDNPRSAQVTFAQAKVRAFVEAVAANSGC